MEAIEELVQLSDSMRQATAVLNDEDIDENSSSSSKRRSTFLNVVALGNTTRSFSWSMVQVSNHGLQLAQSAGKSSVLNSLIGHPALPTGEGGATRAPICIDLKRDGNLSSKSIILQIDSKSQPVSASALRHSLQDKLSKMSSKSRDEIYLKLKTSTAPPFKLVDLPGVDKGNLDDSLREYAQHNDAILLVVIPASQAPEISSARALRIAKEYDRESTRTIGVISKIDQVSSDPKVLAATQALLLGQGPQSTIDIPWVALIGQSVSIASAKSGSDNSLENSWQAESESLKSILTGAPQSKLGRLALLATLADQIRRRMKIRLPSLLSGLQGKSQSVQDELVRLGESMVSSSEGTRALALELCREFEDKFLQHIITGEGSGWKVVASFEGNFPNRIKQIPLDRHFDINNVKRIVVEADGYQPYLISPEKGLRSLIKGVLELAKEPSLLCADEVHRVLVDIVSSSANATHSLGRYPLFKREVVALATAALEGFKNEARIMVAALVDMERVFVPPQHFIRLVQRRYKVATYTLVWVSLQLIVLGHNEPIMASVHDLEYLSYCDFQVASELTWFLEILGRNIEGDFMMSRLNLLMDRQRREEEIKTKSSKKTVDAEQSLLNRASSPQTGRKESGWTLKLMKDTKQGKDVQEGPALKTAGPEGEITAGFLLKKSAKTNGWSRRWFVLNEKTGKLGYTKKQEERHFRGVITLEVWQHI
ncbi:Dynamin [Cynara cardunculus var. scolymus]|uniref:dynamin GTPase n=1 Tax=Cynara cardunculus var. scolymus TaxID=59895 RepID=A0A118JVT6_CYNCS|nr:Dynamin [Cynara cardunculus var. scolymus]